MVLNTSKIIVIVLSILFSISMVEAQVGINTLTPGAALEIKGATSSANQKTVQILNAANRDIFTMQDDGKAGLGVVSPVVGLDLRGTSPNPIIAIGTTVKTASTVGGGAIRYMAGTKEVHYSDGSEWFRLEAALTRPCVAAPNDYIPGSYPSNTTTRLAGYVPAYDSHNAFDQATSVYTAPVDGLYVVSFTLSFYWESIASNSYIEGAWVASNGNRVKCIQAYPVGGNGQAGLTCSGTIQLAMGETVYPEVWHNLGGIRKMRVYDSSLANPNSNLYFNRLSIYAQ